MPEFNPFLIPDVFVIQAIKKKNKTVTSSNNRSEQIQEDEGFSPSTEITVVNTALIDVTLNTKVFRSVQFEEKFYKLPSCGKDLFYYITQHIRSECDYIELRPEKCCEVMDMGERTYRKARLSLMNWVIADRSTRKLTYWVNPGIMFSGNRLNKFEEFANIRA